MESSYRLVRFFSLVTVRLEAHPSSFHYSPRRRSSADVYLVRLCRCEPGSASEIVLSIVSPLASVEVMTM